MLVNVLANAQQAVRSAPATTPRRGRPPIRAARLGGGTGPVAHRGERSRAGHRPRRPAAPVRAVLHDAPDRLRTRPGHRSQYHRRVGRHDRGREPPGCRARSSGSSCRTSRPRPERHPRDARIRTARRRRAQDSAGADRGAARRRPRRRRDRQSARGAAARHRAAVRPAGRRQPDARARRPRAHPRGPRGDRHGRAAADPDDDRARHGRKRDRGDEARRARLPAEAVRDRRVSRRRPAGGRARAPAHAPRLPDHRARRAVRPLRHRRAQPRDSGGRADGEARRAVAQHGAHRGRDGHRQGAGGARDPRLERRSATCPSSASTARPCPTR